MVRGLADVGDQLLVSRAVEDETTRFDVAPSERAIASGSFDRRRRCRSPAWPTARR